MKSWILLANIVYLEFCHDGRIFSVFDRINLINCDRVRLIRRAIDADDEEAEVGFCVRLISRGRLEAQRLGEAGVHANLGHSKEIANLACTKKINCIFVAC